jgi:DNA polymerase III epsilon subunit-like protein
MSWLEALKNLDTETTQETEIDTDAAPSPAAERSDTSTQQGAKSAKRVPNRLLSLLALPHLSDLENHALKQEYQEKDISTPRRPWLGTLRSVEEISKEEEKRATSALPSSVNKSSGSLVRRGAKSAESPTPSPSGDGAYRNTTDAKPKEIRRTLVTNPEQLAEVMADLKDVGLVALDLETTGLNPRKDSTRLLSLATNDATYIVDCQSVDPAELFPILTERTVVAHNALFDLGFLSSLGFEPGKVADTMILSQLLYAGAKVEPLKWGQTSHSLDSVVKRELGLDLDKTHQTGEWGSTLAPDMIEYAARDVEVLLPLCEVLKAKIEEADLTYVAEIEHRTLPAVVWMSNAGVPIDPAG